MTATMELKPQTHDQSIREMLLSIAAKRCKNYPSREVLDSYLEEVEHEGYYKHTRAIECFWQEYYQELLGYATEYSGWHEYMIYGGTPCDFDDIPF